MNDTDLNINAIPTPVSVQLLVKCDHPSLRGEGGEEILVESAWFERMKLKFEATRY